MSSNPCSLIYPGSSAFSEFESQHLRDFILGLNADQSVKMYLTLHSYGPVGRPVQAIHSKLGPYGRVK